MPIYHTILSDQTQTYNISFPLCTIFFQIQQIPIHIEHERHWRVIVEQLKKRTRTYRVRQVGRLYATQLYERVTLFLKLFRYTLAKRFFMTKRAIYDTIETLFRSHIVKHRSKPNEEVFMNLSIPAPLRHVSALFAEQGWPLYAVGGMVRNQILHYPISDMDICGSALPDDVLSLMQKENIATVPKALQFGSLEIHFPAADGQTHIFEYTTFRKDTYGQDGHHRPKGVIFSQHLEDDAFRRDFSVNALYYDLQNERLLDPCGGLDDLQKRILRTTSPDPATILKDDGLRILRLVRFACELGFDIDTKTWETAREYAMLLSDIPVERIWREFHKIIMSDIRYHASGPSPAPAHYRGLKMLDALDALSFVIPELYEGKGLAQNPTYHAFDVMEHNLFTCAQAAPILSVRLAALLHDIGKPEAWHQSGRMLHHETIGMDMAQIILQRLRAPQALIARVCRLVRIHMFDLDGNARRNTLRKHFATMGPEVAREFILLREADFVGSGRQQLPIPSAERFKSVLQTMINERVPFSINDVQISGNEIADLLALSPGPVIGAIKNMLWMRCVCYPSENYPARLQSLTKQFYKQYLNMTPKTSPNTAESDAHSCI